MDDDIGFNFFLNISYKQHTKDFPEDKITFHDFSSICMNNWESLEEEAKAKIIELAKKEQEATVKKESKPLVNGTSKEEPINLDSDIEDEGIDSIFFQDINKVIEVGDSIKKNFGKHYTFCKKPRSAYIYFVKAAHIEIKDRIQCSKDNFVEISRAISSKWNELKVAQRTVFEDLAILDKRFNGFRTDQAVKRKPSTNHTSLFLKAKAEAMETHASVSNSSPESLQNLRNLLAARAARREANRTSSNSSSTKTKRKARRKRTKKRKKRTRTTTTTQTRTLPSTLRLAKSERCSIKTESKFKIKKREC